MTTSKIQQALDDLKNGKFILIYDSEDREGEADFVVASQHITPKHINTMRKDGGGLIFLAVGPQIANTLQLPFMADLCTSASTTYPVLSHLTPNDIPYDSKSSFSLTINHRDTYTGITDNDRALTMKGFAQLADSITHKNNGEAIKEFGQHFRSPGHVPICIAAPQLLSDRQGHTELITALLSMAGLTPVGSGCEIMGDDGKALPKKETIKYADDHGLTHLTGEEIIEAWKTWQQK